MALVIVVVAAVVLGLLLAGVIPGLRAPEASTSPGAFATARAQAQGAADAYDGGNWSVIAASGIIAGSSIEYPLNGTPIATWLNGSGCTYSALAAGTEPVAGDSNVSQGDPGAWLFVFRNGTNALLLVSETPESVTLVGTVQGACTSFLGFVNPIPTTVIESSAAASAADDGGGYAFLRAHPSANGSLTVLGGVTVYGASSPPFWTIGYSDCPMTAGPATNASAFTANVSAVSGALLTERTYTAHCPAVAGGTGGGHTLAANLALGPVSGSHPASGFRYQTAILSAYSGIVAADLTISVQSSTGQILNLAGGSYLNLTSSSGTPLASCPSPFGAWSTGGGTALSSTELFVLVTPTNLSGQGFVIDFAGTQGYEGSIVAGIP